MHAEEYRAEDVDRELGLDRENLVCMALLLGACAAASIVTRAFQQPSRAQGAITRTEFVASAS